MELALALVKWPPEDSQGKSGTLLKVRPRGKTRRIKVCGGFALRLSALVMKGTEEGTLEGKIHQGSLAYSFVSL